jgi:glycosyltransferase involved in cell wall biosynthesis
MLRRCTAVITVSPPIAQDLRRRYGGPAAVLVRNVPEYTQPVVSDRLRQYLGAAADTRIALYQGAFQENRSLDILVRAAAFLEPYHLIVLMGSGASQQKLEGLIAAEGVADRIKILPSVPYKDLLDWTASADLGLILYQGSYSPNVQFCLPNKLFEYLMAGVPVLTSSLDACTEVLECYDVGRVVAELTPEAVGHAISGLLEDREALARMRHNALDATRRDLRWDVEQRRLLEVYDRVARREQVSKVVR